jgi:hypothetical protein
MLPALYDDQRPMLVRIAAMLMIGGALTILPLTSQNAHVASASSLQALPDTRDPQALQPLTFPTYAITRDPFVPLRIGEAAPLGDAQGATPAAVANVRAIVLGNPARALVEAGGTVRVVGIGDRIGSAQVLQIDANALTLSDGTLLPLAGTHP